MSETRTITLTGRPPVRINEGDWPMIASACDDEHDGEVECQANCRSRWAVRVRQHQDGRAIVYATYSYSTNWAHSRDFAAKRGVLLGPDDSPSQAIQEVCDDIAGAECDAGDEARWATLAAECVADLPAEEL